MKEIRLYLYENVKNFFDEDWLKDVPVFRVLEVEDSRELWGEVLQIDDNFYTIGSSQGNNYVVHKCEAYKCNHVVDELEEIEDSIKCPVCGHVESDCCELQYDDDDEYICSNCGSTLSYEREYSVTYYTTVKEINMPVKID